MFESRVDITACGPEAAEVVHRLTQAAFGDQVALDPPTGAADESVEKVRGELAQSAGGLGRLGPEPVACVRLVPGHDDLHVRRLAVLPELQGRGIGRAMMAWAESEAVRRGLGAVAIGVRIALRGNVAFFRRLGYEVVAEHAHPGYDHPTWLEMRKPLA